MKKFILFFAFSFVIIFTSCGPAAENRQVMHERAKVFQDSIANMIRVSMAEAEAPGPIRQGAAPASTAAPAAGQPVQPANQAPAQPSQSK